MIFWHQAVPGPFSFGGRRRSLNLWKRKMKAILLFVGVLRKSVKGSLVVKVTMILKMIDMHPRARIFDLKRLNQNQLPGLARKCTLEAAAAAVLSF
uniref:Uncharacterized protein n=1 Tax=Salix viminalis TaxID=40686 RepID=A0A6N2MKR2_SALVM